MENGNQHLAENILADASLFFKSKLGKHRRFLPFLYKSINNVKPLAELDTSSSRRKKPKTVPIPRARAEKLAINWIIQGANKRTERTMALRIALELLNAYNRKGYAFKKKEELYNICKATYFKTSANSKSK